MKYTPKMDHPTLNTDRREPWRDILIILAATLAGAVLLVLALMLVLRLIFGAITLEKEKEWFSWFSRSVSSAEIKHPGMHEIFVKAGAGDLGIPIDIRISCAPEPNAYALPGGTIVLTSGLLKTLRTEEGLAFVVGHEVGHIKNRDHMQGMSRGITFMLLDLVLGMSDWPGFSIIANLVLSSYSRDQEIAADKVSLQQMRTAYGYTKGGDEFFNAVKNRPEERMNKTFWFLSSHPLTEERLKYFDMQNKDFLSDRHLMNRKSLFNKVLCESGCDLEACHQEYNDGPKSLKDPSAPRSLVQAPAK